MRERGLLEHREVAADERLELVLPGGLLPQGVTVSALIRESSVLGMAVMGRSSGLSSRYS